MTSKPLFWMLIGPAAWMAILLLVASDKADGSVERTGASALPHSCFVLSPPQGRGEFESRPSTGPVETFFAVREIPATNPDTMDAPRSL
jgi:hypothetical protein